MARFLSPQISVSARRYASCIFTLFAAALPQLASAQFELPNTDLWQLSLKQGELDLSQAPRALANSPAYENQPSFSNDGSHLYYTLGDQQGYTDIMVMSLADGERRLLAHTPLSEFSALPLPSDFTALGQPEAVAVVQVQQDGSQFLMLYQGAATGTETSEKHFLRLNPDIAVGYHRWLRTSERSLGVAQFIVAEPSRLELWPQVLGATNTASSADTPSAQMQSQVIAHDIGRGLASHWSSQNQTGTLYFVQHSDQGNQLKRWNSADQSVEPVLALPEGVEDFALGASGEIWFGSGSQLYHWSPGQDTWRVAAELQPYGITQITRLCLHPQEHSLVLVNTPDP